MKILKRSTRLLITKENVRARILYGTIFTVISMLAFALPTSTYIAPTQPALASEVNVLRVPGDFATIQSAVDAAQSGDQIHVAAGVYNENITISTSDLRLHASSGAVVDGTGLSGTGIWVIGTATEPVARVEVSGFEIRNFQRGIVVQLATETFIHGNDCHDNMKGVAGQLDRALGIDLVTATLSEILANSVHNNGVGGISLRVGSTNNVVRANHIYENGLLVVNGATPETSMAGQGVMVTGAGTNYNEILANEILRNYGRGIIGSRPVGTVPITGNLVAENRLHENQRAGIAFMAAAQNNYILQNNATNNNLSGLPPCLTFNLFDTSLGNIWERNQGTSNF